MTSFSSSLLTASLLVLGISIAPAHAQLARTFVSSFGNDANDCNRATPCRTFQRAHNQTLATGEITVLDPGGYGAVTINRTISIINDGVGEAGVLVSGGAIGITVDAGPNDRVSLRGLTVKGLDPAFGASNGIRFSGGASLTIENCAIRNHSGDGIEMVGNVAAGTNRTFSLSNTFVSDNGGNGIFVQLTGSGKVRAVLNRVEMYNNNSHGLGVLSDGSLDFAAAVFESVSANNLLAGFVLTASLGAGNPRMSIIRSLAFSNATYGAQADGPVALIYLSEDFMWSNQIKDWGSTGDPGVGGVISFGDNVGFVTSTTATLGKS